MISLVVCSRNKTVLRELQSNVDKTIGAPYEFVVIDNLDNQYNISQAYNLGVEKAKFENLVFVHEDVLFLTKDWGSLLTNALRNEEIGAVGVAGTNYLNERGIWAEVGVPFVKGRVVHQDKDRLFLSTYSEGNQEEEVVTLDGVFLAARKEVAREIPFDGETLNGFHFYDADWSLRVAQKYRVIVLSSLLLLHKSYGKKDTDPDYERLRQRFLGKHDAILPFTNQSLKPDYKNIQFYKERELKKKDEV